jgi:hypothetical protein
MAFKYETPKIVDFIFQNSIGLCSPGSTNILDGCGDGSGRAGACANGTSNTGDSCGHGEAAISGCTSGTTNGGMNCNSGGTPV